MDFSPGDVFAVKVNSHRSQWNGEVCTDPIRWECGGLRQFREDACANKSPKCFHLRLFAKTEPKVLVPDPHLVRWLVDNPEYFDNQLMFFYGQDFDANVGRSAVNRGDSLYGIYRIKRANVVPASTHSSNIVLEPYPEAYARFPRNRVRKPATSLALDGIPYLHRMPARAATQALSNAQKAFEEITDLPEYDAEQARRLEYFLEQFADWQERARTYMSRLRISFPGGLLPPPIFEKPLAQALKDALHGKSLPTSPVPDAVRKDSPPSVTLSAPAPPATQPAEGPEATPDAVPDLEAAPTPEAAIAIEFSPLPLPEASGAEVLIKAYGTRLLLAIQLATVTKRLLILSGMPGVGKSWMSSRLIDDPAGERSEKVPVSSTWRGREDLLGYVNPVTGEFEPTPFTRFLRRAEQAWMMGDRRTWLAVFEEFNLSQPEHWLSDLLVRLEYDPNSVADRTIRLGGSKIAGEPENLPSEIYLPPTLMLVATLNNDHTVRPLSPRILDRSALVEVLASGKAALERAGVPVDSEVEDIVDEVNGLLESRGVAFSVRAALSLKRANEVFGIARMMSNLDHVLAQEVLSKVRLMAGDPRDEELVVRFREWASRPVCAALALCQDKISGWEESLQSGRDVFQA